MKSVGFLKKESWLVFSQIRVLDSKRLSDKIGKLSDSVFIKIQKEAMKKLFPTTSCNTSPASEEAGSIA